MNQENELYERKMERRKFIAGAVLTVIGIPIMCEGINGIIEYEQPINKEVEAAYPQPFTREQLNEEENRIREVRAQLMQEQVKQERFLGFFDMKRFPDEKDIVVKSDILEENDKWYRKSQEYKQKLIEEKVPFPVRAINQIKLFGGMIATSIGLASFLPEPKNPLDYWPRR